MTNLKLVLVPPEWISRLWPLLYNGVECCLQGIERKPSEVLREWLSAERPDVYTLRHDGAFAGFITMRVLDFPTERWLSVGMLYVKPGTPHSVLQHGAELLMTMARERQCTRINWFSDRAAFSKLAPRLGFEARLIEWTREVT